MCDLDKFHVKAIVFISEIVSFLKTLQMHENCRKKDENYAKRGESKKYSIR